jgi:hypothetical protein
MLQVKSAQRGDNGRYTLHLKHFNCDPRTLFVILKHHPDDAELDKFEGYNLTYAATLYKAFIDSPRSTGTVEEYEAAPLNTAVHQSIDLATFYSNNKTACLEGTDMNNLGTDMRYV